LPTRSYCCRHTGKEWPNTHTHTYEKALIQNKNKEKKVEEKTKKRPKGVGAEGEKKRKKEGRGKEGKGRTKTRSTRSLFVRHSLCAASSIRAPVLCAQRFLIARHSEKLVISIRPLFLCAQRFLIREPFLKLAISIRAPCVVHRVIFVWVYSMEHINCSSLHLPAIVHGGERKFVEEDFVLHECSPPRPSSVSRTNSLV